MDPAAVRKLLQFLSLPRCSGRDSLLCFSLYIPKAELGYFTLMCSLWSKLEVYDEESLNLNLRIIAEKAYLWDKHV